MTLVFKGNVGTKNLIMTPDASPLVAPPGSNTFSFTGADQTWIRPLGITSVIIKAWAAGGGGSDGTGTLGGSGGFTTATLDVTNHATLTIKVGGGGFTTLAAGWQGAGWQDGGNGANFTTVRGGGGGGGRSAIRNAANDTEIMSAGGGGGGGWNTSGFQGNDIVNSAIGLPGSSFQGGNGDVNADAGGGGGGFTGGNGGAVNSGGSGGDGYIGHGNLSFATKETGLGQTNIAPQTGDIDYVAPIAEGALNGTSIGGNGLIVITWT